MCAAIILYQITGVSAKQPVNYGRIFNVQDFIAASGNDQLLGIRRCFTTVAEHIYAQQVNPGPQAYTILFPITLTPYQIDDPIYFCQANGNVKKLFKQSNTEAEVTINVLGLTCDQATLSAQLGNTCPTGPNGTLFHDYLWNNWVNQGIMQYQSIKNFLDGTLASLQMSCNHQPQSALNFLQYTPTPMPEIQSTNPDQHHFFLLFNDGGTTYPNPAGTPPANTGTMYNITLNMMGLKLTGLDQVNNSHVFNGAAPIAQHSNQFTMAKAVCLDNFRKVYVDNMFLQNIYGNGIYIRNTRNDLGYAYKNEDVVIEDNVLLNVWGLHYDLTNGFYDNEGDGISFRGIIGGIVRHNLVHNNLAETHQFGRIGLGVCIENNWNTEVTENWVMGYDRGLHAESCLSGFSISGNRFTHSETAIVFDANALYATLCPDKNPSVVQHNYLSNEGLSALGAGIRPYLQKIYPPHLFYAALNHPSNEYDETELNENEFVLSRDGIAPYAQPPLDGNNQPYLPHGVINNIYRYHLFSGLPRQIIRCNQFRASGISLVPGMLAGGVYIKTQCRPGNLCTTVYPSEACNAAAAAPIPASLQDNLFLGCQVMYFDAYSSSLNAVYNNAFDANSVGCLSTPQCGQLAGLPFAEYSKLPEPVNCAIDHYGILKFQSMTVPSLLCASGAPPAFVQVSATGLNPPFSYTLTPGNIPYVAGGFTIGTAGTYTIAVTDALNLSISTTVVVTQPPALLLSTQASTNVNCNGGSNGEIVMAASGGTGSLTYSLNPNVGAQSPAGTFTGLTAQIYTITATDVNACTSTTTVNITQPAAVAFASVTPTDVSCNGGTNGAIAVNANGGTGSLAYTLQPGNQANTTGNFSNLSAGMYTVIATDANGCTQVTTVTVSQPPVLFWNAITLTNINCTNPMSGGILVQAGGGTGPYTYGIAPNASQSPAGNFAPLLAGNYTVAATDANGCTLTTSVTDLLDPAPYGFCCTTGTPPVVGGNNVILNNPGLILKVAPTAADLLAQYATGPGVIVGKQFYIDGQFTINQDLELQGCTLWFTPGSQIQLQNPYTLDISSSTLQASCDWWGGIVANDPQQKVVVENNSTIRNANTGITMLNGALLEASNSHFEDNGMQCFRFGNIATSNYAGFVKGCTLTTAQNLPAPYSKTQFGIYSINNKSLTIGGLGTGEGNTFDGMQTGIWAGLSDNTLNPLLKVYNNAFANIHDDYTNSVLPDVDLINNCYNTYKGTAIMAYYGGPAMANTMLLEVQNSGPANPGIAFSHCDRGIVTVQGSLKSANLYMDHVVMGMMNFNIIGNGTASGGSNHFDIQHNELHNTYLGMQFAGASANSVIHDNIIDCTLYPVGIQTIPPGQLGLNFIWPKAIDLSDYSNNNGYNLTVTENLISMPHYAGVGINSLQGGSGLAIKENTINLSSTDAGQIVCGGATHLLGIASAQAIGTRIHNNTITANTYFLNNTPNDASLRIDAAGILIDHGQDQAVGCNAIIGARFGLMAYSENNTNTGNELLVQGNTVSDANAGWVFRHLATEGTLGQVGSAGNDNNNVFPGMPTGGPKVFKFCLGLNPNEFIFTTSISNSESKSENMNTQVLNDCAYLIQSNPGATLFNPDPQGTDCLGLQITSPWNGSDIPLDEALAIATDTKVYVEFPALAHWYDCKRLYEFLSANQNLLNSFPVLDSFYTATTNNAIAQIEATDQQLHDLRQSFNFYTPAQREALLAYIENSNNAIANLEQQNENEKEINTIYLKLVRYGMDSLAAADKGFISTLAPQCPYVGGSAVYKARSLNFYLQPGAMYDDMKACNAAGVYKQGNTNYGSTKSLITIENEALAQIKATPGPVLPPQHDVYVYPVPAHSYIHVNYAIEEDATFILYNAVGEKLVVDKLSKENTTQRIDLHNLANGIYNYEVLFANRLKSFGKISIIN